MSTSERCPLAEVKLYIDHCVPFPEVYTLNSVFFFYCMLVNLITELSVLPYRWHLFDNFLIASIAIGQSKYKLL